MNIDEFRWHHEFDVPAAEVRVHEVKAAEILRMSGGREAAKGFAVLHRDAAGAWTCDVYVRSEEDRETLAHELKHCQGWVHQ